MEPEVVQDVAMWPMALMPSPPTGSSAHQALTPWSYNFSGGDLNKAIDLSAEFGSMKFGTNGFNDDAEVAQPALRAIKPSGTVSSNSPDSITRMDQSPSPLKQRRRYEVAAAHSKQSPFSPSHLPDVQMSWQVQQETDAILRGFSKALDNHVSLRKSVTALSQSANGRELGPALSNHLGGLRSSGPADLVSARNLLVDDSPNMQSPGGWPRQDPLRTMPATSAQLEVLPELQQVTNAPQQPYAFAAAEQLGAATRPSANLPDRLSLLTPKVALTGSAASASLAAASQDLAEPAVPQVAPLTAARAPSAGAVARYNQSFLVDYSPSPLPRDHRTTPVLATPTSPTPMRQQEKSEYSSPPHLPSASGSNGPQLPVSRWADPVPEPELPPHDNDNALDSTSTATAWPPAGATALSPGFAKQPPQLFAHISEGTRSQYSYLLDSPSPASTTGEAPYHFMLAGQVGVAFGSLSPQPSAAAGATPDAFGGVVSYAVTPSVGDALTPAAAGMSTTLAAAALDAARPQQQPSTTALQSSTATPNTQAFGGTAQPNAEGRSSLPLVSYDHSWASDPSALAEERSRAWGVEHRSGSVSSASSNSPPPPEQDTTPREEGAASQGRRQRQEQEATDQVALMQSSAGTAVSGLVSSGAFSFHMEHGEADGMGVMASPSPLIQPRARRTGLRREEGADDGESTGATVNSQVSSGSGSAGAGAMQEGQAQHEGSSAASSMTGSRMLGSPSIKVLQNALGLLAEDDETDSGAVDDVDSEAAESTGLSMQALMHELDSAHATLLKATSSDGEASTSDPHSRHAMAVLAKVRTQLQKLAQENGALTRLSDKLRADLEASFETRQELQGKVNVLYAMSTERGREAETKLQSKMRQVGQLEAQLQAAEQRAAQLAQANEALKKLYEDLEQQRGGLAAQQQQMEDRLEDMQQQMAATQATAEAAAQKAGAERAELEEWVREQLRQADEASQTQAAEYAAEQQRLREQLEQAREDLQAQASAHEAAAAKAQVAYADALADIKQLHNKLEAAAENHEDALEALQAQHDSTIADLQEQLQIASSGTQEENHKHLQLQQLHDKLQAQVQQLQGQVMDAIRARDAGAAKAAQLERALDEAVAAHEDATNELNLALATESGRVLDFQHQMQGLERQLGEREHTLELMRKQLLGAEGEYKERVQGLERAVDARERELAASREVLYVVQQQLQEAKCAEEELSTLTQELRGSLSTRELDLQSSREALEVAQLQLQEGLGGAEDLQRQVKELQGALLTCEEELRDSRDSLEFVQRKLQERQDTADELQRQVQELQGALHAREQELQICQDALQRQQQQGDGAATELRGQLQELQAALQARDIELQATKTAAAAAQKQLQAVQERHEVTEATHRREASVLEQRLHAAQEHAAEAWMRAKTAEDQATRTLEELHDVQSSGAALGQEMEHLASHFHRQLDARTTEVERLQAQNNDLQCQALELREARTRLQDELDAARAELTTTQAEHEELLNRLRDELTSHRAASKDSALLHEKVKRRLAGCEVELRQAQGRLQALDVLAAEHASEARQQAAQVEELQQELVRLQESHNDELQKLRAQLALRESSTDAALVEQRHLQRCCIDLERQLQAAASVQTGANMDLSIALVKATAALELSGALEQQLQRAGVQHTDACRQQLCLLQQELLDVHACNSAATKELSSITSQDRGARTAALQAASEVQTASSVVAQTFAAEVQQQLREECAALHVRAAAAKAEAAHLQALTVQLQEQLAAAQGQAARAEEAVAAAAADRAVLVRDLDHADADRLHLQMEVRDCRARQRQLEQQLLDVQLAAGQGRGTPQPRAQGNGHAAATEAIASPARSEASTPASSLYAEPGTQRPTWQKPQPLVLASSNGDATPGSRNWGGWGPLQPPCIGASPITALGVHNPLFSPSRDGSHAECEEDAPLATPPRKLCFTQLHAAEPTSSNRQRQEPWRTEQDSEHTALVAALKATRGSPTPQKLASPIARRSPITLTVHVLELRFAVQQLEQLVQEVQGVLEVEGDRHGAVPQVQATPSKVDTSNQSGDNAAYERMWLADSISSLTAKCSALATCLANCLDGAVALKDQRLGLERRPQGAIDALHEAQAQMDQLRLQGLHLQEQNQELEVQASGLRSDALLYRDLCMKLADQLKLAEQTIVAERQEYQERAEEVQEHTEALQRITAQLVQRTQDQEHEIEELRDACLRLQEAPMELAAQRDALACRFQGVEQALLEAQQDLANLQEQLLRKHSAQKRERLAMEEALQAEAEGLRAAGGVGPHLWAQVMVANSHSMPADLRPASRGRNSEGQGSIASCSPADHRAADRVFGGDCHASNHRVQAAPGRGGSTTVTPCSYATSGLALPAGSAMTHTARGAGRMMAGEHAHGVSPAQASSMQTFVVPHTSPMTQQMEPEDQSAGKVAMSAEEAQLWQELLQLVCAGSTSSRASNGNPIEGQSGDDAAAPADGGAGWALGPALQDGRAVAAPAGGSAGAGGRMALLARAVSYLHLLHDQNRKMVRLLRRLGRDGSLVSQLDALRKENKALTTKYTASQMAHQQMERAVSRLGRENRELAGHLQQQTRARIAQLSEGMAAPLEAAPAADI